MPYWAVTQDAPGAGQGRRCARGERCADAAPHPDTRQIVAAWPESQGSNFCQRDATIIGRVLGGMPERYVGLHLMLGQKTRVTDERVSGSRTAPIPLRADVDALARDMTVSLASWHARIAAAQSLTSLPAGRRRQQVIVTAAVRTLAPRIEDLLRLGPAPMLRHFTIRAAALLPEGTPGQLHMLDEQRKHPLYADVTLMLNGAAAGLEILELDYRARHVLGLTVPPPARLEGIPCKRCDMLALEVAPEPQYKSACSACGDLLTQDEYDDWVKLYAAWARQQIQSQGLEPDRYQDLAAAAA